MVEPGEGATRNKIPFAASGVKHNVESDNELHAEMSDMMPLDVPFRFALDHLD